jgi:Flp pilus assembly protein TadG
VRRLRRDRGSVTSLELVLVAPVLLGVLVFVVFCGRLGRASHAVRAVAVSAARAASVERSRAAGVAAASAVVRPSDGDLTCAPPEVSFEAADAVETVTVRVRCQASMAGLSFLPIGGNRTFEATATEVIDAYRGD